MKKYILIPLFITHSAFSNNEYRGKERPTSRPGNKSTHTIHSTSHHRLDEKDKALAFVASLYCCSSIMYLTLMCGSAALMAYGICNDK